MINIFSKNPFKRKGMILNLNITGKETHEQLSDIAIQAYRTFIEDIDTSNGVVAMKTNTVYAMIATSLMGSFLVNKAVNEAGGDLVVAKELVNSLIGDVSVTLGNICRDNFRQIENKTAVMKELKL